MTEDALRWSYRKAFSLDSANTSPRRPVAFVFLPLLVATRYRQYCLDESGNARHEMIQAKLIAAIVMSLLSAVAWPLDAATLYVSTQGDDTHAGTREEPLRTVSAAAQRAVPGDVVLVLEGVYSERVYVHVDGLDPTQQEVELTTRRRLFAPAERGLGHIVVEGFIFEHCGNQYPTNFWDTDTNAQKGAVGTEAGHHWVIRRNVVRYAKSFAIDWTVRPTT